MEGFADTSITDRIVIANMAFHLDLSAWQACIGTPGRARQQLWFLLRLTHTYLIFSNAGPRAGDSAGVTVALILACGDYNRSCCLL